MMETVLQKIDVNYTAENWCTGVMENVLQRIDAKCTAND